MMFRIKAEGYDITDDSHSPCLLTALHGYAMKHSIKDAFLGSVRVIEIDDMDVKVHTVDVGVDGEGYVNSTEIKVTSYV